MNIKWNHRNDSWPMATSDLRDHIYIVSDGIEMTIARWVDLCHEDPNCGASADEFSFYPVKEMEIIYWYGPVSKPIEDISEYQPERSKREDVVYFCPRCKSLLKYKSRYAIGPNWECKNGHEFTTDEIMTMRCSEHGSNTVREVQ